MKEGIIGILGGIGAEAMLDLFQKIIRDTEARKGQDHLRALIDNNPEPWIPLNTAKKKGITANP